MFSNACQHIPLLFQEIMRNHRQRDEILGLGASMTQADWRTLKDLRAEMIEYRRGAERALRWNTDKGALA